jgi:hypothetical protein
MMLENHMAVPGGEQLARRVRFGASVDEVIDELAGRPEGCQHEDGDEHDRRPSKLARTTTDSPGSPTTRIDEQHSFRGAETNHLAPPEWRRARGS